MRGTAWAFAVCFAAITVVSWRYLFILPIVFSIAITVCLIAAAWLCGVANLKPLVSECSSLLMVSPAALTLSGGSGAIHAADVGKPELI